MGVFDERGRPICAGQVWLGRQAENMGQGGTLIPQNDLRILIRDVPVPGFLEVLESQRVLQQRYTTTGGKTVWRDVPVVEEGEEGR